MVVPPRAVKESRWNKGRRSSSLCEKKRTLVLSLFSESPCWGRRKEASPQRCNPPTPSLRLIPAVAASVPLRTPYSVLCRGSGSELQLGGPEEREREGERERRREREKTDGRQCEQQRESCLMMKGDPLISSSRDSRQTEREGGHAPYPTPDSSSSSLWAFTLSARPISRELLINTHATSLQPVTSSAQISVLKDNLTPVWAATVLWGGGIVLFLCSWLTWKIQF